MEKENILMDLKPFPNEHAFRIVNPDRFQAGSFRRKNIATGIDIIIGRLKGETKTTTQAYRFKKNNFTFAEAKKWLRDNNIKWILAEEATGKNLGAENMEYDIRILPIQDLKVSKKEGKVFLRGYANTKDKADRYGDIPTQFNRDFVYDLEHFKKNPVMLINHENKVENIAGSFKKLEEDNIGLFFESEFSNSDYPLIKHARQVYSEGHAKALSIAGKFLYEDEDNPKHLTLAKIYEISLVPVPADPNSLAVAFEKAYKELSEKKEVDKKQTEIKEVENIKSLSELETYLKAKGLSNKDALVVISKAKKISNSEYSENTQRDAGFEVVLSELKKLNEKLKGV
jgi:HK97 family phage prohead protease